MVHNYNQMNKSNILTASGLIGAIMFNGENVLLNVHWYLLCLSCEKYLLCFAKHNFNLNYNMLGPRIRISSVHLKRKPNHKLYSNKWQNMDF